MNEVDCNRCLTDLGKAFDHITGKGEVAVVIVSLEITAPLSVGSPHTFPYLSLEDDVNTRLGGASFRVRVYSYHHFESSGVDTTILENAVVKIEPGVGVIG